MGKISLKMVTPEKVVYENVVDQVSVMTTTGELTILPDHAPIVSKLQSGELRIMQDGEEHFYATSSGFLEVRSGSEVIILTNNADRDDELDLEKIKEAKELARQIMNEERNANDVAFADAAASLERELARERLATKRKKYRNIPRKPGQ